MLLPIRRTARRLLNTLRLRRHRKALYATVGDQPADYRDYLEAQLKRTLDKMDAPPQGRTQIMVDAVARFADLPRSRVLCVGCRNTAELDYFLARGAQSVTGIDLYSSDPRIQVMDMHQMTFPADQFDVLYTVHALEHAQDPAKVAGEIARVVRPQGIVAVEVPVRYPTGGADLIDFENLDKLHALFAPYASGVLWGEELPTGAPANRSGTPIIRTIFRLR
ncbi:MAG: class I SAM-dependent methyltransferase [Caldilineaceae bacterium]|nr:class I SAM-dependent methyltransferase [Caldilineaceae bacterium]